MALPCTLCGQARFPQLALRGGQSDENDDLPEQQLTMCGHTGCVECLLNHINKEVSEHERARIPCLCAQCTNFMHPNDIQLLLTHPELQQVVPETDRHALWLKFEQQTVLSALGGTKRTKRCPGCNELYGAQLGCNYVRCANRRCRCQFCWLCGDKVETFRHFVGSSNKKGCKFSWDDMLKGSYLLKFLGDTEPCCLFCMTPYIFLPMFLLLPVYMCQRFVSHYVRCVRDCLINQNEYLRWAMMILTGLVFLAPGVFVGLMFMPVNACMYCGWVVLFNPCMTCCCPCGPVLVVLEVVSCILMVAGDRDLIRAIQDSHEAKENQAIEMEQDAELQEQRSRYEAAPVQIDTTDDDDEEEEEEEEVEEEEDE